MILLRAAALVLSLLAALPALADAARDLPLQPARTLKRDIEAGTWMSLALSPDGRTIAFDLLGEIYTMPASGGRARRLLGGMAFETQPTFSPDGRWIAFVSDRSGSDNLWIARADGSAPRQLTFSDDETVYTSPEWRADGKAVFVSHYRPDLNSYELLLQPLDGKGIATVPIRATRETPRADWQSALGASVSRDGRWLYYARRAGSIDFDVPRPWTIVRRNLASGAETVVITGFGGRASDRETFFRPQVSPDGTQLAYATHRAGATELRLRDLATGQDRSLGLAEADAQQSSAWQDLLPRYAFTPDGTALIVSYRGGFERRPVDGSPATRLPFTAPLALEVGPSTRTRLREPTGPVQARLPQAAISSPDGRRVAFSAFGRIHVQPLDGSASARALADPGQPAFQPSWSPDGATIAFVTWSEAQGGAVWTAPADGSGRARRVDSANAFYTYPVFDPAGGRILAHRSAAAARRQSSFDYGFLREAELVALPLGGGAAKVIARGNIGGRLQFDASGRVFVMATDGLNTIDLATGARAPFVQVKGAAYYFQESPAPVEDIRVSPDGAWLVAQVAQQLHLVAMPAKGSGEIDLLSTRLPHRRLTDLGADYFQFTRDGGLEWSVGPQFWRMDDLDARPRRLADLAVALPRAVPKGSVVLRGARVLTMAPGDRVIENADVVVTGDRITAIGPRGTVPLPEGATLRDVAGKILVPGFIDVHDHIGSIRREVLSFEDWSLRARLAYGVTTAFDPSTLSIDMLSYQDAIDAGLMLGPRLRSTGPALFSWNRFASLGEVRDVLRRYRDAYGLSNIKQYRTGNRRVRQWVAQAAREMGMLPTTEGALSLKLDLTQIIDGFAGNEHALPASDCAWSISAACRRRSATFQRQRRYLLTAKHIVGQNSESARSPSVSSQRHEP